jgi:cytidylate kinase
MATGWSIVVNGDLGSGKSTVSSLLARRLGTRRISIGDLYRQMAQQRGMTALELNLHAELDDKIDHYLDQLQHEIAASGERVVVDSRLAWFFFRDALKVHLITDPTVAAHRVLSRPADSVEHYTSAGQARQRLAQRSESERVRFLARYGADKTRLRNYDLVCDSSRATPQEIVARIVHALSAPPADTQLLVDPRRIHHSTGQPADTGPVRLGYVRPHFFVVSGHRAVDTAVRAGRPLVPATLAAEANEPVDGRSAHAYFAAHFPTASDHLTEQRPDDPLPPNRPAHPDRSARPTTSQHKQPSLSIAPGSRHDRASVCRLSREAGIADHGVMLTGKLDDETLSYNGAAMDAARASRLTLAGVFLNEGSGCVRLSGNASYADVNRVGS